MSIYVPGTGTATQTFPIMGDSIYVPYHGPNYLFKLGTRVGQTVGGRKSMETQRRSLDARCQEYTTRRTT